MAISKKALERSRAMATGASKSGGKKALGYDELKKRMGGGTASEDRSYRAEAEAGWEVSARANEAAWNEYMAQRAEREREQAVREIAKSGMSLLPEARNLYEARRAGSAKVERREYLEGIFSSRDAERLAELEANSDIANKLLLDAGKRAQTGGRSIIPEYSGGGRAEGFVPNLSGNAAPLEEDDVRLMGELQALREKRSKRERLEAALADTGTGESVVMPGGEGFAFAQPMRDVRSEVGYAYEDAVREAQRAYIESEREKSEYRARIFTSADEARMGEIRGRLAQIRRELGNKSPNNRNKGRADPEALSKNAEYRALSEELAALSEKKATSPGRSASAYDLTVNAFKEGFLGSQYGYELSREMLGMDNDAEKYEEMLSSGRYDFVPDNAFEKTVRRAANQVGQWVMPITKPEVYGSMGAAATAAIVAGNASPLAALPEELVSVPAALWRGYKWGSVAVTAQVEAGHAYKELIDAGISPRTASIVASVAGAGVGALEVLQLDELIKSYKVLSAVPGASSGKSTVSGVLKMVKDYIGGRVVSAAKEAGEEMLQEAVIVGGANIAGLIDKGSPLYGKAEAVDRILNTGADSFGTFALLGAAGDVTNAAMSVPYKIGRGKTFDMAAVRRETAPLKEGVIKGSDKSIGELIRMTDYENVLFERAKKNGDVTVRELATSLEGGKVGDAEYDKKLGQLAKKLRVSSEDVISSYGKFFRGVYVSGIQDEGTTYLDYLEEEVYERGKVGDKLAVQALMREIEQEKKRVGSSFGNVADADVGGTSEVLERESAEEAEHEGETDGREEYVWDTGEDAGTDIARDDMEDFFEEDEGEERYGFSAQEVLPEDEDEGDGQKNNVSGEETRAAIGGKGKSDPFKDGGTKTETKSTNDGGADGEFWLSNDDLTEYMVTGKTLHTRHKKEAMLRDGKNPILISDNEIKKFLSDVIHGRAPGEVRAFGRVPKKLSDAVAKLRQTLNIDGRFLEIQSDAIRESYKRHSTPKMKGDIALSEADFENLHHYIYNFDGVLSVNDYHGKTEIHIYKKTDKGYYQIITVCSSERNSLQVTKIIGVSQAKFEEKYAKKIDTSTGSPRGQEASIRSTNARHTAGVVSNGSITHKDGFVKGEGEEKSDSGVTDSKKALACDASGDERLSFSEGNKNAAVENFATRMTGRFKAAEKDIKVEVFYDGSAGALRGEWVSKGDGGTVIRLNGSLLRGSESASWVLCHELFHEGVSADGTLTMKVLYAFYKSGMYDESQFEAYREAYEEHYGEDLPEEFIAQEVAADLMYKAMGSKELLEMFAEKADGNVLGRLASGVTGIAKGIGGVLDGSRARKYLGGAYSVTEVFEEAVKRKNHASAEERYAITNVNGKKIVYIETDITKNKPEDMKYTEYIEGYIADLIADDNYISFLPENGIPVYASEDLPREFANSTYTKYLRNRKQDRFYAKLKTAKSFDELVSIATGRRWEKAKHTHNKDAFYGVGKYSTAFAFPVYDAANRIIKVSAYTCDIVVLNASDGKKYLYDIINIKESSELSATLTSREKKKASHVSERSLKKGGTTPAGGNPENGIRRETEKSQLGSTSEDSISQDNGIVKRKAAISGKSASDAELKQRRESPMNRAIEAGAEEKFTYDALISLPDMVVPFIDSDTDIRFTADGRIDKAYIYGVVRSKCEAVTTKRKEPAYLVDVPALGGKVEVVGDGIKHGFNDGLKKNNKSVPAEITARAELMLPEILGSSVEVNRLISRGNIDVPYSSVLLGAVSMENEGKVEMYAVRSVVNVRNNQDPVLVEFGVIGSLYSSNAKKIDAPNGWGVDSDVARAHDASTTISISQLLDSVKGVFDDTLSEDVYSHFGMERKDSEFSKDLRYAISGKSASDAELKQRRESPMNRAIEAGAQDLLGLAMTNEEYEEVAREVIESAEKTFGKDSPEAMLQAELTRLGRELRKAESDIKRTERARMVAGYEVDSERVGALTERLAKVFGIKHKLRDIEAFGNELGEFYELMGGFIDGDVERNDVIEGARHAARAAVRMCDNAELGDTEQFVENLASKFISGYLQVSKDGTKLAVPHMETLRDKELSCEDAVDKVASEIPGESVGELDERLRDLKARRSELMRDYAAEKKKTAYSRLLSAQDEVYRKLLAKIEKEKEEFSEYRRERRESKQRQRLLRWIRRLQRMKTDNITREAIEELVGDYDTLGVSISSKGRIKLEALRTEYEEKLREDPGFLADKNIKKKIDRLSKQHIGDLSIDEVEELLSEVLQIVHDIRKGAYFFEKNKRILIREMADSSVSAVISAGGRDYVSDVKRFLSNRDLSTLTPMSLIKRICGYDTSCGLYRAFEGLNEGQRRAMALRQDFGEAFSELVADGSSLSDFTGKKARVEEFIVKAIDYDNREATYETVVRLTGAMKVSLYLSAKNEDFLRHAAFGGIKIPDADLMKKGRYKDAYANGELVMLSPVEIRKITDSLSEYERAWADRAWEFFNVKSKAAVNEASMQLVGYEIANVVEYFPINVNRNYVVTEFESLMKDATLEGKGIFKKRIQGKNPVNLEDVTMVLERHIKDVSAYAGLAVPINNFQRLYSAVSYSNGGMSVKGIIEKLWGNDVSNYIENVIHDLQAPREDPKGFFGNLSKLSSKQASAIMMMNIPVTLGNYASLPQAAAVLGWKNIAAASAPSPSIKFDEEVVKKHTPLYHERKSGYTTRELGDIRSQHGFSKKNEFVEKAVGVMTAVDLDVSRRIWIASEYWVRENKAGLEVGSDKYYRAVAEIFNKAIEQTQANYSVMQRGEMLRSTNFFDKEVTRFKSVMMQSFNILYDAVGEYHFAKKRGVGVEEAKARVRRAVTSTIASFATEAILGSIGKILLTAAAAYRDDEERLTPASVGGEMLKRFGSSFLGMFPGATEVVEFGTSMLSKALAIFDVELPYDSQWYEMSASSYALLNNLGKRFENVLTSIDKATDGEAGASGIAKSVYKLAEVVSQMLGIPLANTVGAVWNLVGFSFEFFGGSYGFYLKQRLTGDTKSSVINSMVRAAYEVKKSGNEEGYEEIREDMLSRGYITEKRFKQKMADFAKKDAFETEVREYRNGERVGRELSDAAIKEVFKKEIAAAAKVYASGDRKAAFEMADAFAQRNGVPKGRVRAIVVSAAG